MGAGKLDCTAHPQAVQTAGHCFVLPIAVRSQWRVPCHHHCPPALHDSPPGFPSAQISQRQCVEESDLIFAASGSEELLVHKEDIENMPAASEKVGLGQANGSGLGGSRDGLGVHWWNAQREKRTQQLPCQLPLHRCLPHKPPLAQ